MSNEEEQVWRTAGKLRRSLNIGDNDRTTPDSMEGTDDKNGQVMMVEETEIPTSAVLEDAGPAEASEPVIEYGFISRLIEEAGSDQGKSMLYSEALQVDAVPRMETVYETAIAAHQVGVSDQDINNPRSHVESGYASLPVDRHHSESCIEPGGDDHSVDALHPVCPRVSTSAKDVPDDGNVCEMECYIGKSVDEANPGVSRLVTHL